MLLSIEIVPTESFLMLKSLIRRGIELTGYTVHKIHQIEPVEPVEPDEYCQDGLRSVHNHDFMVDPDFCKAYERGVLACGQDYM